MSNRTFFCPSFRRYVLLTASALDHMYARTQRRFWQSEAGGEIYTPDPDSHGLIITAATGPNPSDRRGRHYFNPDAVAATQDRERLFCLGLHAVGLWHTHPEASPTPSRLDHSTTEEYLEAFRGERDYYLMVILGNHRSPPNVAVWSIGRGVRSQWAEFR
jgi:proteasome lid subunit RPN8/RPN11